ncbi:unnamed protein product [Calypogeia fissa]
MESHETEARRAWTSRFRDQKQEMFSAKYYGACATGGLVSAGSAHFLITPFNVLKVNIQVLQRTRTIMGKESTICNDYVLIV